MTTLAGPPSAALARPRLGAVWAWPSVVALHGVLGLVLDRSVSLATAHALVTVAVAGIIVLQTRNLVRVAQAVAYLAVADVLWRTTEAGFFYEGAKYAIVVILAVAMVRFFRSLRGLVLPAAYMATFLPAVVLSALVLGPSGLARSLISANLSGPLALATAVAFFAQVRPTLEGFRAVLWAMLGPITAVGAIAAVSTRANRGTIAFKDASNFVTSGGFGPNQVSALLGLGGLICLLLALTDNLRRRQVMEVTLAVGLLTQATLTFSRGGLVSVLVALVGCAVALARHGHSAARLVGILAALVAAAAFIVLPRLDTFTGGALSERFTSVDTTNRVIFVEKDVAIFRDSPTTGVGLGVSSLARGGGGDRVSAHTEFTRLLAEQGILGLGSIFLLLLMAIRSARRASPGVARALAVAMAMWGLTEMAHSAMRIATIPFVFALAVAAGNLLDEHGSRSTLRS